MSPGVIADYSLPPLFWSGQRALRGPRRPIRWRVGAVSVVLTTLTLAGCRSSAERHPTNTPTAPLPWTVCFSPRGNCTQLVTEAVSSAKRSVLVQAYSFTSKPIAEALIEAHRRGVSVEVLADESQRTERQSVITALAEAGIPVQIDAAHAIAHNKVMVIDGEQVITGSFNFTRAAEERNAENLLIIRDQALASRYAANWQTHRAHSAPLSGGKAR